MLTSVLRVRNVKIIISIVYYYVVGKSDYPYLSEYDCEWILVGWCVCECSFVFVWYVCKRVCLYVWMLVWYVSKFIYLNVSIYVVSFVVYV